MDDDCIQELIKNWKGNKIRIYTKRGKFTNQSLCQTLVKRLPMCISPQQKIYQNSEEQRTERLERRESLSPAERSMQNSYWQFVILYEFRRLQIFQLKTDSKSS